MARELVLAFALKNVERALKKTQDVLKTSQQASKELKEAGEEADEEGGAAAQSRSQGQAAQAKRPEDRSLRVRRRVRASLNEGAGLSSYIGREDILQFAQGNGGEALRSLAIRTITRNLPVVSEILVPLWEQFGQPFVEARLEALQRARLDPLLADLERARQEQLQVRLEQDLGFAEGIAGQAARQQGAIDAALRSGRWTRTDTLSDVGDG